MIQNQTRWPHSYCGKSATGQPFIFLQSITSYNNSNSQSIINEAKHTSLGDSITCFFFLQLPLGFSGRSNTSQNSESQYAHSKSKKMWSNLIIIRNVLGGGCCWDCTLLSAFSLILSLTKSLQEEPR